tara:strand:+ start:4630 stop:5109 length:480 start_codon:yes stop_codon:yes gene_type:complete
MIGFMRRKGNSFILQSEALLTNQHSRLEVLAPKQGLFDITKKISDEIKCSGVNVGLATLFIQHTSASLILQENADPAVLNDLEVWVKRMVPESTELYQHNSEGPDDMPAHIKSTITSTQLSIPIERNALMLGHWQAVYLWEHRVEPKVRVIVMTIQDFD